MSLKLESLLKIVFSVLFFMVYTDCVFAQYEGGTVDHQFFNAINKLYSEAFLEEDVSTLLQGVSDEVRLMPAFQATIKSRSNAETYYKAFFDRFEILSCDRRTFELTDIGKYMIELGHFDMVIQDDAESYDLKSRFMCIWEKRHETPVKTFEAWNYGHTVDRQDLLKFSTVPSFKPALASHVPIVDNISFELQALNVLMSKTIIRHDYEIWSQFFSDDAMFIYTANPIYQGRKELDQFIKKHAVEEMPVFEQLDIRNDAILESGDYVIELASHTANFRSGDYSGINTGKDIRIWRREENGSLKIFRQIAMYD